MLVRKCNVEEAKELEKTDRKKLAAIVLLDDLKSEDNIDIALEVIKNLTQCELVNVTS